MDEQRTSFDTPTQADLIDQVEALRRELDELRRERLPAPPAGGQALRESQELFHRTVEAAPLAMVMVNRAGEIILANALTEHLFGYSRDEMLGQSVELLVPARFRTDHRAHRTGFFQKPSRRSMGTGRDLYGQRKDGSEFPIEIGLNPVETAEGTCVLSTVIDITPRKRAEEALRHAYDELEARVIERTANLAEANAHLEAEIVERRRAEEALRESERQARNQLAELNQIYHRAPVGLALMDTNFRFVRINERLAAINGLPANQHIGRTVSQVVPDLADRVESLYTTVIETQQPVLDVDIHGVTPADPAKERDWLGSYYPVIDDGKVLGISVVVQEITERKRVEEELRESHTLLHAVTEGTTDAVFIKDLQGRYLTINSAGARFVGKSVSDIIGRDDTAIFSLDTAQKIMEGDRKVIASRETQTYEEQGTAAGVTRTYLSTKGVYRDDTGKVIGLLGISRDITERKRTEEALRHSEQQLRRLFEDRERLSQDLHDGILQSLYAVGLTLDASKMVADRTPHQAAKQVDLGILQLNRVIQEIRAFITGVAPQPKPAQSFKAALTTLVRSLNTTGALQVQVQVDLKAAKHLTDDQRIQLLNIAREALSNSVRHSQAREGHISLKPRRDGVRFEIKDNGIGFDAAAVRIQGHGIRNMKARALKMGARLTLSTRPGRGTRILIGVPTKEARHGHEKTKIRSSRKRYKTHPTTPGR